MPDGVRRSVAVVTSNAFVAGRLLCHSQVQLVQPDDSFHLVFTGADLTISEDHQRLLRQCSCSKVLLVSDEDPHQKRVLWWGDSSNADAYMRIIK